MPEPAPAPELPLAPPPASESEPEWLQQWRQAKTAMFKATFDGAKEPAAAIRVAMVCEENDELDTNSDSEGSTWEEEKELAETSYKHALRRLRKAFPDERCDWTDDGICTSMREGCVCGQSNEAVGGLLGRRTIGLDARHDRRPALAGEHDCRARQDRPRLDLVLQQGARRLLASGGVLLVRTGGLRGRSSGDGGGGRLCGHLTGWLMPGPLSRRHALGHRVVSEGDGPLPTLTGGRTADMPGR